MTAKKRALFLLVFSIIIFGALWLFSHLTIAHAQEADVQTQTDGALQIEVDEARLESEPLYARTATTDQIKTYLTVKSADGQIYQADEYILSGTILAGDCEFTVSLNDDQSTSGTVTVYITPQQPEKLEIEFIAENISSTATSQQLLNSMYISGTVTFNDIAAPVDIFDYRQYITIEDVDLRPDAGSGIMEGQTYTKDVDFTFSMNGKDMSVAVPVTIRAEGIMGLRVQLTGTNQFEAGQQLTSSAISVAVIYNDWAQLALTEGEYEIIYDSSGNYTDRLEFGDTSVTIRYTEGGQVAEAELGGLRVTERPIDGPSLVSSVSPEYDGQVKEYVFSVFNEQQMKYTLSEGATAEIKGTTLVVSATDARKYTVRFETTEGFCWSDEFLPNGAHPVYEDPDDEESAIIAFEYTIEITKAALQSAAFEIDDAWTYLDTVNAPDSTSVTVLNRRGETVNLTAEGATVTYTYVNAEGTPAYSSNVLPEEAGTYIVTVSVTDLKNYNDLTDSGMMTFTISPRKVALPTLKSTSLTYNASSQRPEVIDNYTFEAAVNAYTANNAVQVNAGTYNVTFRLTSTRNYVWEDGTTKDYFIEWKINAAKNKLENISIENWTYDPVNPGQQNRPTATFTYMKGSLAPTYYYSYRAFGSDNYTVIENINEWQWSAGEYRVWASYPADDSKYNNFYAYDANEADGDKYTFIVDRFSLAKPDALIKNEFTYKSGTMINISEYIPNFADHSSYYELQGTISAENAGKYTVTIVLNGNYGWTGGGTENIRFNWTILRAGVTAPSIDESDTFYSGSEQEKTVVGYYNNIMTFAIGGSGANFDANSVFTATNVGDYSLTVSFSNGNANNYYWAGGDPDPNADPDSITLDWRILKAQAAITGMPNVANWTYDTAENAPSGAAPDAKTSGFKGVNAYYVWSDTEDGGYTKWSDGVPTKVGKYYIKYIIDGTSNFDGTETSASVFKILRATVDKPVFTDGSAVYDSTAKTSTVSGYISEYMNYETEGVSEDAVNGTVITLTAVNYNDGGYYIVFTLKDPVNYTWSDSSTDPEDAAAQPVRFTWAISKADNEVVTTGSFNNWLFGEEASDIADLGASAKYDGIEVTFAVYKASEVGAGEVQTIANNLSVGDYVLRASVAAGTNTNATYRDFAFKVIKNTEATVKAEFTDADTWTYRDVPHAFTAEVTVGTLKYDSDEVTVTYRTKGWGNEWSASFTSLSSTSPAGVYEATVTINENDNFSGSAIIFEFTIRKFVVTIPEFTRTNEFDEGKIWQPVIAESGEGGSSWSKAFEDENSASVGTYWLTLTLTDFNNYCWDTSDPAEEGEGASHIIDEISEGSAVARLWYRITRTQFEMGLSLEPEWTYGDEEKTPSFANPGNGTVTYVYAGTTDNGEEYGSDGSESAIQPTEAGSYTLTVYIAESADYDQNQSTVYFTILPRQVTVNMWSNVNAAYGKATDASASFTGTLGHDDLMLTYLYSGQTYIGEEYDASSAHPVRAGEYKVVVELGNKNYYIGGTTGAYDYTAKSDYIVNKVELTLTAGDIAVTYGKEASGYNYTYSGLVNDDDIETVLSGVALTYEAQHAEGGLYRVGDPVSGKYVTVITYDFISHPLNDYNVTLENGVMTLNGATLTVTVINPDNAVYTGQPFVPTYSDNRLTGDTLTFVYSYYMAGGSKPVDSEYPVNAGSYYVVVTLENSGDAANYIFERMTGEDYTISPAVLSIKTQDVEVFYNGLPYDIKTNSVTKAESVNDQNITWEFSLNEITADGEVTASVKKLTDVNGSGGYTVYYRVSAPNHKTETGNFVFNIRQEQVLWRTEYSRVDWTYGSVAGNITDAVAKFAHSDPNFLIVNVAYYGTRTGEDGNYQYSDPLDESFFNENTPAGTYYAVVSVKGAEANVYGGINWLGAESEYSFEVTKAKLTLVPIAATAAYGTGKGEIVWNGFTFRTSAGEGVLQGSDTDIDTVLSGYTLVYTAQEYDAGDHVGKYTIAMQVLLGEQPQSELKNYILDIRELTDGFTVNPVDLSVNITVPDDLVYRSAPITPGFSDNRLSFNGEKDDLVFTYTYYKDDSSIEGEPVNVGTYSVYVTLTGGADMENYNFAGVRSKNYTIVPKELTNAQWQYVNAVYGSARDASVTFDGVLNGEDLAVTYTYDGSADHPVDVEVYSVVATIGNANYCAPGGGRTAKTEYTVTKATLIVTANAATAVYGTEINDIVWNGYTISGWKYDDEAKNLLTAYTPEYTAAGYAAGNANGSVGTYDISVSLPGASLGNYDIEYAIHEDGFRVTKRSVAIGVVYQRTTYGDSLKELTWHILKRDGFYPVYNGDSASDIFTLGFKGETPENVGTYHIIGSAVDTLGKNYALTFIGQNSYGGSDYEISGYGIYEIVQRSVSVTLSENFGNNGRTYDGKPKEYVAEVGTGVSGVAIDYELRYSGRNSTVYPAEGEYTTTAPTNAGDYIVKLVFTDPEQGHNYSFGGTITYNFTIDKANYNWSTNIAFNSEYEYIFKNEAFTPELNYANTIVAGADGISVTVNYYTTKGLVLTVVYGTDGEITRKGGISGIMHVSDSGSWRAEFVIDSPNYNTPASRLSTVITVTPRVIGQSYDDGAGTVSVIWSKQDHFTYDGTNQQDKVYAKYTPLGADAPVGLVLETVNFTDYVAQGYIFTVSGFDESDEAADDYALPARESRQHTYHIDRREVSIAASDGTGIYGETPADPGWLYSGDSHGNVDRQFVDSDGIEFTVVTDADGKSNVGTYTTYIQSVASGSERLFNYIINGRTENGWEIAEKGVYTVKPRALGVTVTANGVTYTGEAYSDIKPSPLTVSSDAVNNDTIEWVYTYYKDGGEALGTGVVPVEAGSYYVVVTLADEDSDFVINKNGNYTFTAEQSKIFVISPAKITIERQEGFTAKYNGAPHYFLTENGHQGEASLYARTLGEGNEPKWLFTIEVGEGTGDFSADKTIDSLTYVKDWDGIDEEVYIVYFVVTATNHDPAYGSFEVTIERAENSWNQIYSHSGWEYDNVAEDFDFLAPVRDAVAAFGDVDYLYFSDEACLNEVDENTFFRADTPAGTYYVKAFVSDDNKNYAGIESVYEITVRKQVLSIRWEYPSIALNDDQITQNSVYNYDSALMRFNDETPGLGFDGDAGTVVKPGEIGDYYVTLELVDPDNYAWSRPLTNERLCRITFSVNTDVNNVTVTVTGGGWTYGDKVTLKAYEGAPGDDGAMIVVVADSLLGDSEDSVSYTYAYWKEGVYTNLSFTMSTLPTNVGRYVVRAFVQGETGYGANAAYAEFLISPKEVTSPVQGEHQQFTYKRGTTHEYMPEGFKDEISLPDGRTVALMTVSGNRAINAGEYTALVSLADPLNFIWNGGGTDPVPLTWRIEKQTLSLPTLGDSGKQSITTVYGKQGLAEHGFDYQNMTGFDALTMGIAEMTAGYRVVDGKPSMTADGAGSYIFRLYLKDSGNYRWANEVDSVTLSWTVTKAIYDMSAVKFDQEEYAYAYNGLLQYPTYSGTLPEGLDGIAVAAQYSGGATHVSDGRQSVTVTFRTTSPNYVFENGTASTTITAYVVITPFEIENVRWTEQKNFTFNGEDQSSSVVAEYEAVDGRWVALALEKVDFTNYREEGYTFIVAGFAAADDHGDYALGAAEGASQIYYIDKMHVTVVIGDRNTVYNGKAALLTSVAGSDYTVISGALDITDLALENGWNRIDLTIENGEAVNAGKYVITLADGYNEALVNFEIIETIKGVLTVTPAPITIDKVSMPDDIVFGEVDPEISSASVEERDVNGIVDGDTFAEDVLPYLVFTYTGTANDGTHYDGTHVSSDIKAGSYTVTVTLTGGNYTASPVSDGYVVARKQLASDAFSAADVTYDGTSKVAQVNCSEAEYAGLYEIAEITETYAGSYKVYVTLTEPAYYNYRWDNSNTDTFTLIWTIKPASAEHAVFGSFTVEDLKITNWGETAGGVSVENAPQYWFATNDGAKADVDGFEWSADGVVWTHEAPTAAGNYYIRAYVNGTVDHEPLYSEKIAFEIGRGTYDMSGVTFNDESFVYDGTERNLTVRSDLPVGADGVVVTVSVGAGSVNVVDKHAVQAIFTSHSANYVFENGESTYTLTAYLTVTAHSVQVVWEIPEFTYNGKVQHNADDPGIRAYYTDIDGEKVYLIVGNSADGEFRDWREDGYRFTVYGDDANYALSSTQATVMMNKAAITVIVEDKQSVYGEADAELTYLSDGETFGQNISVVLSREAGSDVGEYTIGADISGADNFEVTVIEGTYTIIKAQIDPSVSLEGWVFGEAAGEPVVIGAAEGTVTYLYTGMTNGGKQWNSMSAPTEAGSYTLTVTIAETANTSGGTASVHFTVARTQLAVPTLGDSGENKLTAVYEDEIAVLPITGFDPLTMGVYGVAVSIDGSNVSIVAASAGERTAHVYLKDANNYEWVSGGTDEVLLIWTLEESTDSLSWLIIVLGSLFAVEIILFIIALIRRNRRGGTPASEGTSADGTSDGVSAGKEDVAAEESAGESGDGSTQSNAFAFAPLMMLSVPIGQIGAIIGLGIACVALAVADVVLFVRKKKHADTAEAPAADELSEPLEEEVSATENIAAEVPDSEDPDAENTVLTEEGDENDGAIVTDTDETEVKDDEDNEHEVISFVTQDENRREINVLVRYNFSFRARLIRSSSDVKRYYGEIMDEINSYEGIKTSVSWRQLRIYKGRKTYAHILFKGKKLCVAYNLDPAEFAQTKYRGQDMSEIKRFAKTPMLLKVFSDRKSLYARHLFAVMFSRDGITRGESIRSDFTLPCRSIAELIEDGLVKVLSSGEADTAEAPTADELSEPLEEEVSATENIAAEVPDSEDPDAENTVLTEEGDENDGAIVTDTDETEVKDDEDNEHEVISFVTQDENRREINVLVRYNFSFRARLIRSSSDVKRYYGEIMDEINSYEGIKTSVSWRQLRIYKGRKTYAHILFKGKKLCVAYNLDPAEFAQTKYRGQDMSEIKRFAKTPMLLKVFSDRKSLYARHLFAVMFSRDGITRGESIRSDFALPCRSIAELIEDGLVKVLSSGEAESTSQVRQADIAALIREHISLYEAKTTMTDEVATALIQDVEESSLKDDGYVSDTDRTSECISADGEEHTIKAQDAEEVRQRAVNTESSVSRTLRMQGSKKGIVNIDSLSRAFASGEVVTVEKMRKKKLLKPGVGIVKVLARGVLDKPLIVEAHDFSLDAVKMIILTGGKAHRLRSSKIQTQ